MRRACLVGLALLLLGGSLPLEPTVPLAAPAVPLSAPAIPLAAPAIPRTAAVPRTPAAPIVHQVRAGDTLGAIAARYGTTVASLVTANRLADSRGRLRIGQRLTVPSSVAPLRRPLRVIGAVADRRPSPPRNIVLAVPDFAEVIPLFVWPVDGRLSSVFGRRRTGWHRGIDIKADLGVAVAAAAGGTVLSSGYETRYGRVIKIEHLNGFMSVYAHNDQNLVEPGDRVTASQTIAAVGRTGRATAHHLHFEIRHFGLAYNPLYMLPLPPRVTQIGETDEEEPEDGDD